MPACQRVIAIPPAGTDIKIVDMVTEAIVSSISVAPKSVIDIAATIFCDYAIVAYVAPTTGLGVQVPFDIVNLATGATVATGYEASMFVPGSSPQFRGFATDPATGIIYAGIFDPGWDCADIFINGCPEYVDPADCDALRASCEAKGWPSPAKPHVLSINVDPTGSFSWSDLAVGLPGESLYVHSAYNHRVAQQRGGLLEVEDVLGGTKVAAFSGSLPEFSAMHFAGSEDRIIIVRPTLFEDWDISTNSRRQFDWSSIGVSVPTRGRTFAGPSAVDAQGQTLWVGLWNQFWFEGNFQKIDLAPTGGGAASSQYGLTPGFVPTGVACLNPPSIPTSYCGDGTVDAGEDCDDGNVVSGDGCSSTCAFESSCGDGILDPDEQCDDANNWSRDGCSASCETEAPAWMSTVGNPNTCHDLCFGSCSVLCPSGGRCPGVSHGTPCTPLDVGTSCWSVSGSLASRFTCQY